MMSPFSSSSSDDDGFNVTELKPLSTDVDIYKWNKCMLIHVPQEDKGSASDPDYQLYFLSEGESDDTEHFPETSPNLQTTMKMDSKPSQPENHKLEGQYHSDKPKKNFGRTKSLPSLLPNPEAVKHAEARKSYSNVQPSYISSQNQRTASFPQLPFPGSSASSPHPEYIASQNRTLMHFNYEVPNHMPQQNNLSFRNENFNHTDSSPFHMQPHKFNKLMSMQSAEKSFNNNNSRQNIPNIPSVSEDFSHHFQSDPRSYQWSGQQLQQTDTCPTNREVYSRSGFTEGFPQHFADNRSLTQRENVRAGRGRNVRAGRGRNVRAGRGRFRNRRRFYRGSHGNRGHFRNDLPNPFRFP